MSQDRTLNNLSSRRDFFCKAALAGSALTLPSIDFFELYAAELPPAKDNLHPVEQTYVTLAISDAVTAQMQSATGFRAIAHTYTDLSEIGRQEPKNAAQAEAFLHKMLTRFKNDTQIPDEQLLSRFSHAVDQNYKNFGVNKNSVFARSTEGYMLSPGVIAGLEMISAKAKQGQPEFFSQNHHYLRETVNLGSAIQSRGAHLLERTRKKFQDTFATKYRVEIELAKKAGLWFSAGTNHDRLNLLVTDFKKHNPQLNDLFTAIDFYKNHSAKDATSNLNTILKTGGDKFISSVFGIPDQQLSQLIQDFKGAKKDASVEQLNPSPQDQGAMLAKVKVAATVANALAVILARNGKTEEARFLQKGASAAMAFAGCAGFGPAGMALGALSAFTILTDNGPGASSVSAEQVIVDMLQELSKFLTRFSNFVEERFNTVIGLQQETLNQIAFLRQEVQDYFSTMATGISNIQRVQYDDRYSHTITKINDLSKAWDSLRMKGERYVQYANFNPGLLNLDSVNDWIDSLKNSALYDAKDPELVGSGGPTSIADAITTRKTPGLVMGYLPKSVSLLTPKQLSSEEMLHPKVFSRAARAMAQFRLAFRDLPMRDQFNNLDPRTAEMLEVGQRLQTTIREATTEDLLEKALDAYRIGAYRYVELWRDFIRNQTNPQLVTSDKLMPAVGCETGSYQLYPLKRTPDYFHSMLTTKAKQKLEDSIWPPYSFSDGTSIAFRIDGLATWQNAFSPNFIRYVDQPPSAQNMQLPAAPRPCTDAQYQAIFDAHFQNNKLTVLNINFDYLQHLLDLKVIEKKQIKSENMKNTVRVNLAGIVTENEDTTYFFKEIRDGFELDTKLWSDQSQAEYWKGIVSSFQLVTDDLMRGLGGFKEGGFFRGTQVLSRIKWFEYKDTPGYRTEDAFKIFAALSAAYARDLAKRISAQKGSFDEIPNHATYSERTTEQGAALKVLFSLARLRSSNDELAASQVLETGLGVLSNSNEIYRAIQVAFEGWDKNSLWGALPHLKSSDAENIKTALAILDETVPKEFEPRRPDSPFIHPAGAYHSGIALPWRFFPVRMDFINLVEAIVKGKIDASLKEFDPSPNGVPKNRSLVELDTAMEWLRMSV